MLFVFQKCGGITRKIQYSTACTAVDYSRRKYYCYHQNAIPLKYGNCDTFLQQSYRSSNICDSNSCRSFTHLKALAKSNCNLFAIVKVGRAITLEIEPSKKKQRTDTKKDAKRMKSDKGQ